MAQQESIFTRALSVFRKDGVRDGVNAPVDHTPSYTNNASAPLEKKQQQFLDWQVDTINKDLFNRSNYSDYDRPSAYRDYVQMDNSPEIAAAMNIIRDECLASFTVVPTIDSKKYTIEELFEQNKENFYVYSYNPIDKIIEVSLCERVAFKGEQDVFKITFDDDSFVVATSEHLWLIKGDDKYLKTSELTTGDPIESINAEHSIKSVEFFGREKTYDLVNVGKHHNFAIETSNGTSVFTHNCLTRNERGNILEIYSENPRVKEMLKELFKDRLNIDYNLRLWIRELIKYGDFFLHLHIDGEGRKGVFDVMALPCEEIHRQEGVDGIPGNTRFWWDSKNLYFEDWQVAHFRLIEEVRRLPYGRSFLDPARKLWKQLQLAEDAMLVYRITRAPERKVFYIEAGNIDDADMPQFINQMKTRMKRQPVVDARTGQVNLKYNPATVEEDYYIPVRGKDTGTRIDTLPGASNMNDIMDIEYLEKKLFAALQVPKPYLNYTESMPGGSMLAQADLRFARLINSIQEAVVMELRRIGNVHLLFMGFEDDLDNFSLALTNPSTQQELLNLETWKTRLEVFKDMFTVEGQSPASYTWAMENILGFSKEEIKLMLKQKKVEAKIFAEIASGPETYKKIGLFDEIDKKFEDPSKAASATTPEAPIGGGDVGFSGGGGNPDFGLGTTSGSEELGGETTPEAGTELAGAETPAPETGTETTPEPTEEQPPISESVYFSFLNELFEEDEPKKRPVIHENSLTKNNELLNFKTHKLKESMNKFKKKIDEKNKIRNEVEIDEDKIITFSEKRNIIQEKRKK